MTVEEKIFNVYKINQTNLDIFKYTNEGIKKALNEENSFKSKDEELEKGRKNKLQKYISDETEKLKVIKENIVEILEVIPIENKDYLYKFGTHEYRFKKNKNSLRIKIIQKRVDQSEDILVSDDLY